MPTAPWRTFPLRLASLPEPAFDPDEARRAVSDVLSRPEYADLEPGLLERLLRALAERLGAALSVLEDTGFAMLAGWVVIGVTLAVLAALLLRYLRRVRRDPAPGVALEGQVGRSPQDWYDEADGHERAGALRAALRCRYRGLVAELAAAGVVEERSGRTSGEYLAVVRGGVPAAARSFAAVTAAFEAAWYGGVPPGSLDGVRELEREVRSAARVRARRPPVAGMRS